jgi:hypothetical protein
MKSVADWIRDRTPGWTDEDRYRWISRIHTWVPPICLVGFVFTDNVLVRFLTLCLLVGTIVFEFVMRECIVTMVEREFSDSTFDDLFDWAFRTSGWELTRPEKMTLNIGLNTGFLMVGLLMLFRQSVLWITWVPLSVIPALGFLSRVPLPPGTAGLPLGQIPLPPALP